MWTIKVVPISNVRLTSSVSVFTSLSWSADIFRACYSISMHMRQSERETDKEILTGREEASQRRWWDVWGQWVKIRRKLRWLFLLCFYIKLSNERAFKTSRGSKKTYLKCSFSTRKQEQRTSSHLCLTMCSKWQSFTWSTCVFHLNPGAYLYWLMMEDAFTWGFESTCSWHNVGWHDLFSCIL